MTEHKTVIRTNDPNGGDGMILTTISVVADNES